MTYTEFRYSLRDNLLTAVPPPPSTIIINYNTVGGVTTIDDVAILIENGNLPQLQEATSISLSIPELNGGIININVESSTNPVRVIDKGIVGGYYCYSIITPEQRPVLTILPATDPEDYNTDVVIEPVTATGAFNYNNYNPIIGNTLGDRESSYRVFSDRGTTRLETRTNPVNIISIISDRAIPANIQDSLYSDTGWIQGRYEGTKTTAEGYGGIDPTIAGISFTGAYYPVTLEDTSIREATIDTRVIQEYFLIPGKGIDTSVPVITFPADPSKSAIYRATGQLPPTRTLLDLTVIPGAAEVEPIKVGDYLYLYNEDEIVKVEQVERVGSTTNTTIKRFMFGTNPNPSTSLVETTVRVLTDINRLYQVDSNRIEFIGEGKIWVQASGDILRLDELGYSATGSVYTQ
jgi:hypothetical protein